MRSEVPWPSLCWNWTPNCAVPLMALLVTEMSASTLRAGVIDIPAPVAEPEPATPAVPTVRLVNAASKVDEIAAAGDELLPAGLTMIAEPPTPGSDELAVPPVIDILTSEVPPEAKLSAA